VSDSQNDAEENSAERLARTSRREVQIELGRMLRLAMRPPEEMTPELVALIAKIKG
jgi:hypothetical protein